MLIHDIKANIMTAKKNRDSFKSNLLSTLYAEAAMIGKNAGNRDSSDDEVIVVIQKFIKNNNEMLAQNITEEKRNIIILENSILNDYLPKQLTSEELESIINNIISDSNSKPNIGFVMGKLKLDYFGRYDSKLASTLVKNALS